MEKRTNNVKQAIIDSVEENLNICLNCPLISEIGDGNINRVFRIEDEKSDVCPMVVKYAPESAVILPTLRPDRNRGMREGKYLELCAGYVPDMVPKVIFYDEKRYMLFIEDLGNVRTLSAELINGDFSAFDTRKMAHFSADTCFYTSDFAETKNEKIDFSVFDYHDLCVLTKELVFEQPYYPHENNRFMSENEFFVEKKIYSDKDLKNRVEELKNEFLFSHQAVIHGDLHTASVFAKNGANVVFDGEFSYNGPIAFDTGNVIAHLLMAFFRWSVIEKTRSLKNKTDIEIPVLRAYEYLDMSADRFSQLVNSFGKENFNAEHVIEKIKKDSFSFAGTECVRRVVGLAKSPIFTEKLTDNERMLIERCLLFAGSALILNDKGFCSQKQFLEFCKTTFNEGMNIS